MRSSLARALVFLFVVLGVLLLGAPPLRAEVPKVTVASSNATFAIVIGSNQSVDQNLTPLRYADDDAARYLDLFRLLGARTYLLTRLDENTRRLHPQAAAEASDPRKVNFDNAITQLIADVTKANQRGVETVVYFVYAGHGNVQNGEGYITLEDLRLTGADLARTFTKIPATRIHVIADACASYFLAYSRGPGGERRPIEGFGLAGPALLADSRIGLLLSTSSARESHEWDQFQSGVFSHEVRSGLYGAADADGDGQVSYREIASFVARANARVPNERYRPDVHARAPKGGDMLLDLRRGSGRKLEIDGKHSGHYFLEDGRGVRIADVHNAEGQTLSLVRPAPAGRVYLRRTEDDKEFVVDAGPGVVSLANLHAEEPRTASRGAAHESFSTLFDLPFDKKVVEDYPAIETASDPPMTAMDQAVEARARTSTRRSLGLVAAGIGVVAIGVGAACLISAKMERDDADGNEASQLQVIATNSTVSSPQLVAGLFLTGGAIALGTGALLYLWPSDKAKAPKTGGKTPGISASVLPGGGFVGYGGTF